MVNCVGSVTSVDVVFDVYAEYSIKVVERARRIAVKLIKKGIDHTSQIIEWNQLLYSGNFKNKFPNFFVHE